MKRVLDHITKPKLTLLIVFAVACFVNLTAYVWWFSFVWELVFSVTCYIVGLLLLVVVGLGISIFIDKKFGSSIRQYFIIALVELLFIWLIANPIRTWQIKQSFARANDIIEPLRKYKSQFGTYPTSLNEAETKLKRDIPDWTYLGTVYEYNSAGDENYRLNFQSYYGYTASYNKDEDDWIVAD
jgi:hypothetical protein